MKELKIRDCEVLSLLCSQVAKYKEQQCLLQQQERHIFPMLKKDGHTVSPDE